MTAYLTRDELLSQTIPGEAFAGLTPQQIDSAIASASSTADSYLRKRYALPLVSWGEDLRSAVARIAAWQLLTRRGIRPGSGNNEVVRSNFEDAMIWLRDVAKGLVEVECVDGTPDVDEDGSLAASDDPLSFRWSTGSAPTGTCCDDDE